MHRTKACSSTDNWLSARLPVHADVSAYRSESKSMITIAISHMATILARRTAMIMIFTWVTTKVNILLRRSRVVQSIELVEKVNCISNCSCRRWYKFTVYHSLVSIWKRVNVIKMKFHLDVVTFDATKCQRCPLYNYLARFRVWVMFTFVYDYCTVDCRCTNVS